ncbi:MAG: UDP-N-acetylglucosamine 2-epimerase (non-hydrolyzing), partial [Bacillota bacterium]
MKKYRVLCCFGTRPEAIKMAPVVRELAKRSTLNALTAVTGQHRELLDQVLHLFDIPVDYDLNVMIPRQSLTDVTVNVLRGMEKVLEEVGPDMLLVHGDTATTLAASLAAYYRQVPVGHVEAGLRTFDRYQPFPEEMNRVLTDHLAALHFAPTGLNREHLRREGIEGEGVFTTGNTAVDAITDITRRVKSFADPVLAGQPWKGRRLVLAEVHRRENFGRPLRSVFRALLRLAAGEEGVHLVVSVHPNPEVQGPAEMLRGRDRILLMNPAVYSDWANLMARAHFIVTDSGGLQEEAPALGVPVLLARDKTERQEAEDAGTVWRVGTDEESILAGCRELLND